ncbi:hypothetical protein HF673_19760, partial [Acidithiobacillus thiooxidans]|nr:hypothetical protein [Acidithiobacillus thiooxidans]
TILPGDTGDAPQILRHADLALYAAKARGRNQYCFYEKTLDVEQEQLMEMLAMTQEALEAQNLVMYYQPVVTELCSKVVYGRVTTGLNEVAYCCYKGFPTQRAT